MGAYVDDAAQLASHVRDSPKLLLAVDRPLRRANSLVFDRGFTALASSPRHQDDEEEEEEERREDWRELYGVRTSA
jgi:hypothetical protein